MTQSTPRAEDEIEIANSYRKNSTEPGKTYCTNLLVRI